KPGNPLLPIAAHSKPRHHGLGADSIQIRQHPGRRQREVAIRPLLHQEHVARTGPSDHGSDNQDRNAGPRRAMRWVFWGAAGLIAYTYLGYAGWLWLRSRWRPQPVRLGTFTPFISIVLIVRNEATVLSGKLRNLMELNYPEDLYEIVVVSDGSTDDTNQILSHHAQDARVRVIVNSQPGGKAAGLNEAVQVARGEIVVFTDARHRIEPDAARPLLQNFADPNVGCDSGELMLGDPDSGEAAKGIGLYCRIGHEIRG